jgi:hypothetical protein
MSPLSSLSAAVSVPYRHRVSAVAGVAPVSLNLEAPATPYNKPTPQNKLHQSQAAQGRYNAQSAGPAFAAHILVEAGLAGSDPFVGARGAKAYDSRRAPLTTLRLVA